LNYSRFIYLLKKNKIIINRKILSQLAIEHENEFNKIIEKILPKK
jgi:ribosomal protein L20